MDIAERIWEALGAAEGRATAIYLGHSEKNEVKYYMLEHGMSPPGEAVKAANMIHGVEVFYVDQHTHFRVV